jgi:hypothetical protein
MECRHRIRQFKPGLTLEIGPVESMSLTPSSQRADPLPLYFAPDPVKLRLAVMQSEVLVEAAQHHHKLLLLIPPLPVPMLAEPFLGFGQELSAAFVAWDPYQGELAATIRAADMLETWSPTVAFQIFDPVGIRMCHEAQSLHWRYGLDIAMSTLNSCRYLHEPKTRFPVGRLFPFPGRESHPLKAPGLAWRTDETL